MECRGSALEGLGLNPSFWAGKRVLLTGHTGFKGSWLALWLARLGADVTGIALAPETTPNLFVAAKVAERIRHRIVDIRDAPALAYVVAEHEFEIVLHLAAQALVRRSYADPLTTFATNVSGTVNLLHAITNAPSVRAVVVVTSDKVYRNPEHGHAFTEDDPLGGHDPYSASKAAAELAASGMYLSFLEPRGVAFATARAGNVIGGGDWSTDRIIPDAIRAWSQGSPLGIRNPNAVRPWQHVLESLAGYLALAEALYEGKARHQAYNFGPGLVDCASVAEVIALAEQAFGGGAVTYAPEAASPHEAGLLRLDNQRAADDLDVRPRWALSVAVERSLAWYRRYYQGADPTDLCHGDIAAFESQHG